jgi:hypothetical protein
MNLNDQKTLDAFTKAVREAIDQSFEGRWKEFADSQARTIGTWARNRVMQDMVEATKAIDSRIAREVAEHFEREKAAQDKAKGITRLSKADKAKASPVVKAKPIAKPVATKRPAKKLPVVRRTPTVKL